MDGCAVFFNFKRAAAGAQLPGVTFSAECGHIFLVPQPQTERMIPDRLPLIRQDIPNRFIPGLAGEHIPVRLDAHAVFCSRAGFKSHAGDHRIKITVLRGCIPQQALTIPVRGRFRSVQQLLQPFD